MKCIFVLIFLFALTGHAQIYPVKNGEVYYEFIDSLPGQSKTEIYQKAEIWCASQFRDAKQAVQLADKENGELVAKGNLPLRISISNGLLQFTLRISARENKCRVSIYNITYTESIAGTTSPIISYTRKRHIAKFNSIMIDLKNNIFSRLRQSNSDTF